MGELLVDSLSAVEDSLRGAASVFLDTIRDFSTPLQEGISIVLDAVEPFEDLDDITAKCSDIFEEAFDIAELGKEAKQVVKVVDASIRETIRSIEEVVAEADQIQEVADGLSEANVFSSTIGELKAFEDSIDDEIAVLEEWTNNAMEVVDVWEVFDPVSLARETLQDLLEVPLGLLSQAQNYSTIVTGTHVKEALQVLAIARSRMSAYTLLPELPSKLWELEQSLTTILPNSTIPANQSEVNRTTWIQTLSTLDQVLANFSTEVVLLDSVLLKIGGLDNISMWASSVLEDAADLTDSIAATVIHYPQSLLAETEQRVLDLIANQTEAAGTLVVSMVSTVLDDSIATVLDTVEQTTGEISESLSAETCQALSNLQEIPRPASALAGGGALVIQLLNLVEKYEYAKEVSYDVAAVRDMVKAFPAEEACSIDLSELVETTTDVFLPAIQSVDSFLSESIQLDGLVDVIDRFNTVLEGVQESANGAIADVLVDTDHFLSSPNSTIVLLERYVGVALDVINDLKDSLREMEGVLGQKIIEAGRELDSEVEELTSELEDNVNSLRVEINTAINSSIPEVVESLSQFLTVTEGWVSDSLSTLTSDLEGALVTFQVPTLRSHEHIHILFTNSSCTEICPKHRVFPICPRRCSISGHPRNSCSSFTYRAATVTTFADHWPSHYTRGYGD